MSRWLLTRQFATLFQASVILAYLDMSRNQVINPLSLFYFFAQDFRSDLAFKKQDTRLTAALDTRRLWGALSYRACFVVYFSFFSVVLLFCCSGSFWVQFTISGLHESAFSRHKQVVHIWAAFPTHERDGKPSPAAYGRNHCCRPQLSETSKSNRTTSLMPIMNSGVVVVCFVSLFAKER